jgi:plasmid stabilization system protein ParE
MARVEWTSTAEDELTEIAYWIAVQDDRPRTARKVVDEILRKAELYAATPGIGQRHFDLPEGWLCALRASVFSTRQGLASGPIHNPIDAIHEPLFVEVDKQSPTKIQEAQMGKRLSLVERVNHALCLEFHDNQMVDQQVGSKSAFHFHVIIDDWHWLLFHNVKSAFPQFIGKAYPIRGLQQSGAKPSVDFDGGPDDGVRQVR